MADNRDSSDGYARGAGVGFSRLKLGVDSRFCLHGLRLLTLPEVLSAKGVPARPTSPACGREFYQAICARADLGTRLGMKRHYQLTTTFETLSLGHAYLYR